MKSRLKRPVPRVSGPNETIFCWHGMVYHTADDSLSIIADSADQILDRLRKIDGVVVVGVRGRWCDLECPPLRLPDVTSVLVPLNSVRARKAVAAAAYRGRIR